MRIDAYSAINQAYMPTRAQGVKAAQAVSAYGSRDEFQISSVGKDLAVAKQAVSSSPDVREDLVAEMKKKYSGDSFDSNPSDFADVLLSRFNQII